MRTWPAVTKKSDKFKVLREATPLMWHVAIRPGHYLRLDDVVAAVLGVPGRGLVTPAAVVTAVRSRHEGASFPSEVFLISDGVMPGGTVRAEQLPD
jgi:uncharacterized protein